MRTKRPWLLLESACASVGIARHAGEAAVESRAEEGSTFQIGIPGRMRASAARAATAAAHAGTPPDPGRPREGLPEPATAAGRAQPRAFVVDDEEAVRGVLHGMLAWLGCDVIALDDPRGLCPVDSCRWHATGACACGDMVLCDLRMPHLNGLQLVERQIRKSCRIPNAALMSGGWTAEEEQQALRLGCQVFHKPILLADLRSWVAQCQERIKPGRELAARFGPVAGPGAAT